MAVHRVGQAPGACPVDSLAATQQGETRLQSRHSGREGLGLWLCLAGWNTTNGSGMRVLSVALLQTGDA